MNLIDAVVVAIPARDEAARLPDALAAVAAAAIRCPVPVMVVVAADACTDDTAAIAAARGVLVVVTDAGRVGPARDAAVRAGLVANRTEPARIWVAGTDADSRVPADWLTVHLAHAEVGVQLLRGGVQPDPAELDEAQLHAWRTLNPNGDPHGYVHGANLGLTGSAYLAAGGFADVAAQEDVLLVRAVEALGLPTASTSRAPVTTSARLVGRAEGGFARYLTRLHGAATAAP